MKDIRAVVFDLYGTLYDVHSVVRLCDDIYPGQGDALARLWRQKQLEYTWLRSLMGLYVNFEMVTGDALRFGCAQLRLPLDAATQQRLSEAYLRLSPFPDTLDALKRLRSAGLPLGILSNGSRYSIGQVVGNAGMHWAFDQLISVEEVQVFKPDKRVYRLAEQRMGCKREEILFISSNAWDASGAAHFGFPVCWIDRQGAVFDELGVRPTHTVPDLGAMADWLLGLAA
ncbi:MAG: 2-haloacid dehalogenase [Massilia sp.]|jgi:2-haloacid dehalogenase